MPPFFMFSKSTIHVYAIIVGGREVVRPIWTKSFIFLFLIYLKFPQGITM